MEETMLETLCFEKIEGKEEYCVTGLGNVSDVDIVIPSTYNGLPVTCIGDWAFESCDSLQSIAISKRVTNIGDSAFSGCSRLTIYSAVDSKPNGWSEKWNPSNRPVEWGFVGKGVTKDGIAWRRKGGSISITGYKGEKTVIRIPNTINKYSVTEIVDSAFSNSSITSVEIPNSVTSIGAWAFYHCSGLTSVVIPNSVTSIGDSVFAQCKGLTSVEIPKSITSIGAWAFHNCSGLTSVVIPNSVTSIGASAFAQCSSITSVVIPNSVTSVGDWAFLHCEKLTSANIPKSVTSIGYLAFSSCSALSGIEVDKNNSHYQSIDGNLYSKDGKTLLQYAVGKTDPTFIIPNGVTSISDSALNGCKHLTRVVISDGVTSIGARAFDKCESLTNVEIPDSVTSIGYGAFSGCSSLTIYCKAKRDPKGWNEDWNPDNCSVEWGFTGKEIIDEGIVWEQEGDTIVITGYKGTSKEVKIPKTINNCPVTSIRDWAFEDCSSLMSVVIPNSVTSVGDGAFVGCKSLKSIAIPNSVTSIGYSAFAYCSSLMSIGVDKNNSHYQSIDGSLYSKDGKTLVQYAIGKTNPTFIIPNSVTGIGDGAFADCSSLKSIEIPNSVTSIGDEAFYNCSSLTNIAIPNSVTSIGVEAFFLCSLKSVVIPNSVTSIGERAFWFCSLKSVVISNSVTSIGENAFSNCDSLTIYCEAKSAPEGWDEDWNPDNCSVEWGFTGKEIIDEGIEWKQEGDTIVITGYKGTSKEVKIPKTINNCPVTTIGDSAFEDCRSLMSIVIPDRVTSIGKGAFVYCRSLTNIEVDKNNNHYQSLDGNLYTKDGKTLVQYAIGKTDPTFIIPNSVTSIGDSAFGHCSSVTSVVIPNSVTSIGNWAFADCSSLRYNRQGNIRYLGNNSNPYLYLAGAMSTGITSTTIDENCRFIGDSAFYNCSRLKSIAIPNSVTSIGGSAFKGCSRLTSIAIPNSVTSIGGSAFSNCSSLTSVVIPNSVTSIGGSAFSNCSSLTSVVIPNGVTSIGDWAFSNCSSVTSVEIPNSVTSIGDFAFYKCSSLTSIEIPNSVTSIGEDAFRYCRRLKRIEIPDSVTSIGEDAFRYCSSLTIYCEAKRAPKGWNEDWNPDNCSVEWGFTGKEIIDEGIVWKQEGDTIVITGYKGTSKEVKIPKTINNCPVTSIGESAFEGCSSLTNIAIPNSVKSIGKSVFAGCINLTNVEIPNSVTSIGESAFEYCSSLKSIAIPNSVTSICGWAFYKCESLTNVEIPDSVTSIGDWVFADCSSITSVEIPNSVTSIGYFAFSNCSSLTNIEVDKNNNHYQSIDGSLYSKDGKTLVQYAIGKTNPTFIIPNSATSIGDFAFYKCSRLKSIEIPNSVTSIGFRAFYNCSSLTSVEIPNSVTSVGDWAFEGCSNLTIYCEAKNAPEGWNEDWNPDNCSVEWGFTGKEIIEESIGWKQEGDTIVITGYSGTSKEVKIPKTINNYPVTSIGAWAFSDCNSLTSVVIPNSVTEIGDDAFYNCSRLKSIAIPNSVTSIGDSAFKECSSLKSIAIPNSVTSIGDSAFAYCSGLTRVVISYGVTSIGFRAFYKCSRLKSIEIPNSVTSIDYGAFSGCSSLTIYCKAKSAPEGWNGGWNPDNCSVEWGFTRKEIIDEGIVWEQEGDTIVITGYKGTSKEVKIPKTINNCPVTSIGAWAFHNCSGLTSVVIPNSVASIGASAFAQCSSLTSVVIPNSVTSIGERAFCLCSLKSVVIPNSVTSIGVEAFSHCRSLTSVVIPHSVTSIGIWAFGGCSSLTIYCEAERELNGWDSSWNPSNRPVVWGYKGK